jgi:hypothetical protein
MTGRILKSISRVIVPVVMAGALAGCFDLNQSASVGRDGSGQYKVAITAEGLIGSALKSKSSNADLTAGNKADTEIRDDNGRVTRISTVHFKSLSDLRLGDEAMSIETHGADFFGIGSTHATFRYIFAVDRARREHARDAGGDEEMGKQILQTMFGGHTYVLSVTLPGSIQNIAPVRVGDEEIKPEVTGDFWNGHTITWRMPLATLFAAKSLTFSVDYSAYGSFGSAHSQSTGNPAF